MNRFTSIALSLVVIATLSACQSNYSKTLDQKLEGKSQSEKRAILAEECRNEIRQGLNPENPANVRHFETTKKICEELTGKKIPMNKPRT